MVKGEGNVRIIVPLQQEPDVGQLMGALRGLLAFNIRDHNNVPVTHEDVHRLVDDGTRHAILVAMFESGFTPEVLGRFRHQRPASNFMCEAEVLDSLEFEDLIDLEDTL